MRNGVLSCPCSMPTSSSAFKNMQNTNNVAACGRHVSLWVCCVRLSLDMSFCYFLYHAGRLEVVPHFWFDYLIYGHEVMLVDFFFLFILSSHIS